MDRAVFGRAPDVDHLAAGRRLEIQVAGGRDGASGRRAVDAERGAVPHGRDVAGRLRLQRRYTVVGKARPDFGLPPAIERFDGGLQAGLPRWGENRGEAKPEAQAHHATHGITMLMRALEDIVVVELDVARQADRRASARATVPR